MNDDHLISELKRQPIVEVLGVVDPHGAGGGSDGSDLWVLQVSLAAWKNPGGQIQNRELSILKELSHADLKFLMQQVKAYDVVRLRAHVAEVDGAFHGLLVQLIGKESSDVDLNAHSASLQQPVTFNDDRFGTFTLDRSVNWFEGHALWGADKIRLTLSMDDDDQDVTRPLAVAHSLWDSQKMWDDRMAEFAATKLLDVKNDNWLDEDEADLTSQEFKSKMQLENIYVSASGNIEFWYNDGNLFWGHSIRVSGTLSAGPDDAGIEG